MTAAEYARPEILVDTAWLAAQLDDPSVRVVDADYPQAYGRAHIPGAVGHLDANIYLKSEDGATLMMGPDQFAQTMVRMGIGNDTTVVVYDSHTSLYAARFWWMLKVHGHRDARILNGGWHKWLAESRPVTMARATPRTTTYQPEFVDSLHTSCDLLRGVIGRSDSVIVDVRNIAEYTGQNDRGNKRRGHVPGAIHLEWLDFMTSDDNRVVRPAAELRAMLESRGITRDKNVHVY